MALSPVPDPDVLIYDGDFWAVVLNRDQGLLGRCFCLLKRPETDLIALTGSEVQELWELARRAKAALTAAFAPDHFNFAALMNQDPQVHFHVIPRYRTEREFAGTVFTDAAFGGHYVVAPPFLLSDDQYAAIREVLATAFAA